MPVAYGEVTSGIFVLPRGVSVTLARPDGRRPPTRRRPRTVGDGVHRGGAGSAAGSPPANGAAFLDWVRRIHAGTRFTTSVCTGSLVLGAAGLLNGLTATTHWDAAAQLESYGARYTAERVVRQYRVITSAGVSSGVDMALRPAALLGDETTAQAIQLYTEDDPQPPYGTGSVAEAPAEVLERAKSLWG
ncbi:DJ-1/PfpI family protein [Streptomyces seoulensis]